MWARIPIFLQFFGSKATADTEIRSSQKTSDRRIDSAFSRTAAWSRMKSPRLGALRRVFITTFLVLLILLPMLRIPKSLAFLLALASAGWVTWLTSVLDKPEHDESLCDRLQRRERRLKAHENEELDDPPY